MLLGTIASHGLGARGGDFDSIATVTVGAGGTSTITFSSIPATYSHLQIRCIGRSDQSSGWSWVYIRFNGDSSTNYGAHSLYGDGSSAGSSALIGSTVNTEMRLGNFPRADKTANVFGAAVIDILDYTSTSKNKTVRFLGGTDVNGSGYAQLDSGLWFKTPEAITSITLTPQTANWVQYSHFALYGIKAA